MLFRWLYYTVKPRTPWRLRIGARRWWAAHQRSKHKDLWPINQAADTPPEGWPGWPEGKQFALVLGHDVEGSRGVARCRQLMELEQRMGFRSAFNFVPEGDLVPAELRHLLQANGFEVGVHDLKHDGKLFVSRERFRAGAQRINHYLKDWGAVGFRAGFMLHELNWFHDLEVLYDASTFDIDPFEPQPDGVHTIFPFWVPNPQWPMLDAGSSRFDVSSDPSHPAGQPGSTVQRFNDSTPQSGMRAGYVELPYTLVQDFNLFVVLRERTIDFWKRKLDWIASRGGMAFLTVHPDYTSLSEDCPARDEFPIRRYEEFLDYARTRHAGRYWNALPREVAGYVVSSREAAVKVTTPEALTRPRVRSPGIKIWVDLDNTPHVPFFKPIIRELEHRGYRVALTARDAFQVCELATQQGLRYTKVGRHYGRNVVRKGLGLIVRTLQLLPFVLRERPALGLSHGARSQILLCNLLRVPTVLIMDYEHSKSPPLTRPLWEIVPESVPEDGLHCRRRERSRRYSGIKEDVYAPEFRPDSGILEELGLSGREIIVTVRPPATEAHYHNPESERLFARFMDKACRALEVKVVLLPRNKRQEGQIRGQCPQWFENAKTVIPLGAVDGLNLLWHSDLVVSGGGTMNREAAALGVPVYSIFRGQVGAVDRTLEKEGRLVLIASVEDVDRKIPLEKRAHNGLPDSRPRPALQQIVNYIEEIIRIHYPLASPSKK